MIGADWHLIYEFDGGAVYWISWKVGDKVDGKMVTFYDKDLDDDRETDCE